MSFSFHRINPALFVLAGVMAMQSEICQADTSYQLQAANLQDAGGTPANGLVVFVASRSNSVFSIPTTTNFVSEDDIILATCTMEDGILDVVIPSLELTNGWGTGDPLAIYWFPTLTTGSTFPIPANTPYGFFSDADGLATGDGSDPWQTPGDGAFVNVKFLTASYEGSYSESAGRASLVVGNHPPVANSDSLVRTSSLALKVAITYLLTNDTDSDNDPLTLTAVSISTNNVTLSNDTQYVYYPANAANVADSFNYTITDGKGFFSTTTVQIGINPNVVGQVVGISNASGSVTTTFAGVPGLPYTVQRATDVNFSVNLTNLVTTNAPAGGLFQWIDPAPPSPAAFYRLRYN